MAQEKPPVGGSTGKGVTICIMKKSKWAAALSLAWQSCCWEWATFSARFEGSHDDRKRGNTMSIPTSEQETVVQYDRNGETMTVYTTDSTQITRLDKIYQRHKEHKQAGEVVAVEYVVSKRLLSYRSRVPKGCVKSFV